MFVAHNPNGGNGRVAGVGLPAGIGFSNHLFAGQFHGDGSITLPNGDKYFGKFKDGKRKGKGLIFRPDGSILQSGFWENDVFVGGR